MIKCAMHVDCLFFARIKKGYYKSVLKSIPEANASIEIKNITFKKSMKGLKSILTITETVLNLYSSPTIPSIPATVVYVYRRLSW